jgi:hypothetical protein
VRVKLGRVDGFSGKAISAFARRNFHPGCTVVSDGLHCFGGVTEAGCTHKVRIPVDREHRFRLIVNINSSRS